MRLSSVKSFPPKILKEYSVFCISIYVPTNSNNINQDIRKFKSLVDELEALQKFKEQVSFLRNLENDHDFWNHNLNSLVILMNQNQVTINKLTMVVPKKIFICNHFYVLPLIDNFQKIHRYFLLLLKENSFNLYYGNYYGVFEIDVIDNLRTNRHLTTKQYYKLIDQFTRDNFTEVYDTPLLIAATDPIQNLYRNLSSNPRLLSNPVQDIPMTASAAFIHIESRKILETLQTNFSKLIQTNYVIYEYNQISYAIINYKISLLILNRNGLSTHAPKKDNTLFEINNLAELALKYDTEVIILDDKQMPIKTNVIALLNK